MDDRLIRAIGSGNLVVDLGCGSGELLDALGGRFVQRIGLDVSRKRLETMAGGKTDGWEFREADLNGDFPIGDESVDAVLANQVIEHIVDPLRFGEEIYRVLRPGGVAVLTTPNIRYIKSIVQVAFSGYGPRTAGGNTLDGGWDDGHLHYFTHRDLQELFQKVGFSAVESRALVELKQGGVLRGALDRFSASWPVREFMSGNILVRAVK